MNSIYLMTYSSHEGDNQKPEFAQREILQLSQASHQLPYFAKVETWLSANSHTASTEDANITLGSNTKTDNFPTKKHGQPQSNSPRPIFYFIRNFLQLYILIGRLQVIDITHMQTLTKTKWKWCPSCNPPIKGIQGCIKFPPTKDEGKHGTFNSFSGCPWL